jgi:secreted trypsin-like serine protease
LFRRQNFVTQETGRLAYCPTVGTYESSSTKPLGLHNLARNIEVMMRCIVACLMAISLVARCESTQHSHISGKRIVGGKEAVKGRYAAYGIPLEGSALCGATLIAPDLMISAAHCKGAFTGGSASVAIGGTKRNLADAPEIIGVAFEVAHPDYDPATAANDVMIVKLDRASSAVPVEINDQPNLPIDGAKVNGFAS